MNTSDMKGLYQGWSYFIPGGYNGRLHCINQLFSSAALDWSVILTYDF